MFRALWIVAFAVPLANAAAASSSAHSHVQSVSNSDRHHHHRFMQAAKEAVKSADPEEEEDDSDDTETEDEAAAPEVSKVQKMTQKLEELNTLEVKLEDRLEYLENEHYEQKIAMEQKPVANETVPALAKMLGSMRKEMHEYVTPFYNEELEDRLEDIEEEQIQLKKDIAAEEEGGKKKEKEEVKEEKKEEVKEEPKEEEPETTTVAPKRKEEDLWHTGTKVLIAGMVGIVLFIVISFIVKRRQA